MQRVQHLLAKGTWKIFNVKLSFVTAQQNLVSFPKTRGKTNFWFEIQKKNLLPVPDRAEVNGSEINLRIEYSLFPSRNIFGGKGTGGLATCTAVKKSSRIFIGKTWQV